ncbi:replication-relaxation family protein [Streptomyces sp. AN091965]|uniref:replication-relaxation family protein n=1 Tax=Streptomyces sp. AN091965 TaxID=2927803 RepID=UPI001F61A109|nr:replication-relaxation family protein [Streptomyces sp. AN091965]MCI3928805.1 replication-relaxation family protein [Streptomyces sp. AN091965]
MTTNPMPQRALRGHRPKRLSSRTATTGDYLARLAHRLTPRDRWLARMLYEHRVLTTGQIADLAWPSTRAANLRLLQLYKWRVLDRFQPFITYGSAPMHYVLDVAGALVVAREDGLETRDLSYRHERAMGIAYSLQLVHTVGANGFFTALVARSRQADARGRLTTWWSEGRCQRHFGDLVRPDAYGRWREPSGEFEWFLEYDCGTERPPDRVARKLADYAKLASTTGITTPILVWAPTTQREARVRRALAEAGATLDDPLRVPVATTTATFVSDTERQDPSQARWLPMDAGPRPGQQRLRLVELATAWPHLPALTEVPANTTSTGEATGLLSTAPPPRAPQPRGASRGG